MVTQFRPIFRVAVLLAALATLSACGCVLDEGDSTAVGDYWKGCMAAAKKTN